MVTTRLALIALLACACQKPAATAPPAPRKAQHLSTVTKPLAILFRGPADDAVSRALVAQFERYRAAQPFVTYERTEGELSVRITYGAQTTDVRGLHVGEPARASLLVARALREVIDREAGITHRIGFLSGDKGREVGDARLASLFAKSSSTYTLERVDARSDLPPDLEALLVTSPRGPISSQELRRVDRFLMRGGPLAIFGNNLEVKDHDPSMYAGTSGGLVPLLRGYGLRFETILTVDKRQFWQPVYKGITLDPYPPAFVARAGASATFEAAFTPFVGLPLIALAFPSELIVDAPRAKRNGANVRSVAWTGTPIINVFGVGASLHPSRDKMGNGATSQKEEARDATLAVAITGAIGSAFDAPGDGIEGVPPAVETRDGRLLVISSGSFLANPFYEAGSSPFANAMPGMDPHLGADEELLRYAELYEPLQASALLVAQQSCDWLLRTDEWIDP